MANVPKDIPFLCGGFPAYPGAYLINGGAASYPIFCSITSYTDWGMNNLDDYYLIMPGYTLIVYKGGSYSDSSWTSPYSATTFTYWNGFSENNGSSCRLYFGNVLDDSHEIKSNNSQSATFTSYTPSKGPSNTTIS